MYDSKHMDKRNYRSLIIAGAGTIGKSLITLGVDQLNLFEHVSIVDSNSSCLASLQGSGLACHAGDISDPQFLRALMAAAPNPSLFVNLCSGTNNLMIRNNLASYDTAYLDSCASTTEDQDEYRFSRLMPYTYSEIDSRFPHWLCWGINPGLVEIITRKILAALPDRYRSYDIAIYEFDRLSNPKNSGKAAVGWCPDALVEEIMLSPTMEIINGQPREEKGPGTRECLINWGNKAVPARIVGHEDIWNLSEIPSVKNSCFYYSLDPAVMNILSLNNADTARNMLSVPGIGDDVAGLEQVAVQIDSESMTEPKTLVWTEDHGTTWKNFGVNAVQYQTAKSLLLAIMLLQRTDYGLKPFAHNASSLPITPEDWPIFDLFMQELGINWNEGSYLNLYPIEQRWENYAA
jgi:hypothetical protein